MSRMLRDFASSYLSEMHTMLDSLDLGALEAVVRVLANCRGIVWLAGNGGSASLASHMATDLQLAGVRAVALTDVAAITTYANDVNFYESFSRLGNPEQDERDSGMIPNGVPG